VTPRRRGGPRFSVEVTTGGRPQDRVTQRLSGHNTSVAAFERLIGVLQQWAASEGAVTPGTRASIVDTNDGGELAVIQYLGYEANMYGGTQTWQKLAQSTPPISRWPK